MVVILVIIYYNNPAMNALCSDSKLISAWDGACVAKFAFMYLCTSCFRRTVNDVNHSADKNWYTDEPENSFPRNTQTKHTNTHTANQTNQYKSTSNIIQPIREVEEEPWDDLIWTHLITEDHQCLTGNQWWTSEPHWRSVMDFRASLEISDGLQSLTGNQWWTSEPHWRSVMDFRASLEISDGLQSLTGNQWWTSEPHWKSVMDFRASLEISDGLQWFSTGFALGDQMVTQQDQQCLS